MKKTALFKSLLTIILGVSMLTGCDLFSSTSVSSLVSSESTTSSTTYNLCSGYRQATSGLSTSTSSSKVNFARNILDATGVIEEVKESTFLITACYVVDEEEYEYITSGFVYDKSETLNEDGSTTYYAITNASGITHRELNVSATESATTYTSDDITTYTDGVFELAFEDGSRFEGNYVAQYAALDIAIFSFNSFVDIPLVTLGSSDQLSEGEQVYAIGTPLEGYSLINTVVQGVVSGLHRRQFVYHNSSIGSASYSIQIADYPVFQFDAPTNFGMEGGPVINRDGEVIGITSYKYYDSSSSYESLSLAIAIDDAKNVIDNLIDSETYTRPMMGVSVYDMTSLISYPTWYETYHITNGIVISEVSTGTPSATAGMVVGEVIRSITNNTVTYDITNLSCLSSQLLRCNLGDSIIVTTINSSGTLTNYTLAF